MNMCDVIMSKKAQNVNLSNDNVHIHVDMHYESWIAYFVQNMSKSSMCMCEACYFVKCDE